MQGERIGNRERRHDNHIRPARLDVRRAIGTRALRIISYGYVFYAWGMVVLQAFNGAGDTATPTWINFFIFWVYQLPAAWLLAGPLGVGYEGVFWAVATAYSMSALVGLWLFRRGGWKRKKV